MTVTANQIDEFLIAVNVMIAANNERAGYKFGAIVEAKIGSKYAKIIKRDVFNGVVSGGSAFCFVEMETGNILKAASWAAPAKGIRGNIANGASQLTPYGAVYFR